MKKWKTKYVEVEEIKFDGDLHQLSVASHEGIHLGLITPVNIENMNDIIDELDVGRCPIVDAWEDGNGNTCTMDGWGQV